MSERGSVSHSLITAGNGGATFREGAIDSSNAPVESQNSSVALEQLGICKKLRRILFFFF